MNNLFVWIPTILLGLGLAGSYLYFSSQPPTIIELANSPYYTTKVTTIDTYDFLCQFDKDYIGIPKKILLRKGEMSDEIIFSDNFSLTTTDAEIFDWKNYQGKVLKIKVACEGYLDDIKIIE